MFVLKRYPVHAGLVLLVISAQGLPGKATWAIACGQYVVDFIYIVLMYTFVSQGQYLLAAQITGVCVYCLLAAVFLVYLLFAWKGGVRGHWPFWH